MSKTLTAVVTEVGGIVPKCLRGIWSFKAKDEGPIYTILWDHVFAEDGSYSTMGLAEGYHWGKRGRKLRTQHLIETMYRHGNRIRVIRCDRKITKSGEWTIKNPRVDPYEMELTQFLWPSGEFSAVPIRK